MNNYFLLLLVSGLLFIGNEAIAQQVKQLEFDHIFDGTFEPESVRNVDWMRDGQYYTALVRTERDLELRKYDVTSGDFEVIVRSSQLDTDGRKQPIIIQDYQFSANETNLLIKTDVEQIWRRSTRENYFVYDLETGNVRKLTDSEKKQQYAQLSPEGDKAAFVIDNNLYWVNLRTGEETQITTDGEYGHIINGAA
ncbi:MAG: DPP IV N-terminal domain-containing protein, partial [Balneolaceae bacterium]|nr:DPP IV N-terminal domain-containing protein [Balneolaceae bacterium]